MLDAAEVHWQQRSAGKAIRPGLAAAGSRGGRGSMLDAAGVTVTSVVVVLVRHQCKCTVASVMKSCRMQSEDGVLILLFSVGAPFKLPP